MIDITEHIQKILQFINNFNIDKSPNLVKRHRDISLDNIEVYVDNNKIILHHVLTIENESISGVENYLNNIHINMNGFPHWGWKFDEYGQTYNVVNGISYANSFGIELEIKL
jgi:hypothetical protein